MEPPLRVDGAMWAYDPTDDPTDDCFHSGGDLYRVMSEDQKETLIGNTARNIRAVLRDHQVSPRGAATGPTPTTASA